MKRYKKSEEVKELQRVYNEYKTEICLQKGIPAHAIRKVNFRDDTTRNLTNCVIAFAHLNQIFIEEVPNKGRYFNGQWVKDSGMKGTADLHGIYNGRALRIEIKCKATKDRQRPDQKIYQRKVEKAGGAYLIVREFKDFFDYINQSRNV